MSRGHLVRTAPNRAEGESWRKNSSKYSQHSSQHDAGITSLHPRLCLREAGELLFCNEDPKAEGGQVPVPRPPTAQLVGREAERLTHLPGSQPPAGPHHLPLTTCLSYSRFTLERENQENRWDRYLKMK